MCGDSLENNLNYSCLCIPHGNQPPELKDRDRKQNRLPVIQEEVVSDLLSHLGTHKSVGQDGIHASILRGLVEELVKLLPIIYHQSWLPRKVDWRLANVASIHKKGRKKDLGNYRHVSLTLLSRKVMEQVILSVITWHLQENQGVRPSEHAFRKPLDLPPA